MKTTKISQDSPCPCEIQNGQLQKCKSVGCADLNYTIIPMGIMTFRKS
jgi:hypothetical protein